MTATHIVVAKVKDTSELVLFNASSRDLIGVVLVKIRIIPVKITNLDEKLVLS